VDLDIEEDSESVIGTMRVLILPNNLSGSYTLSRSVADGGAWSQGASGGRLGRRAAGRRRGGKRPPGAGSLACLAAGLFRAATCLGGLFAQPRIRSRVEGARCTARDRGRGDTPIEKATRRWPGGVS
jgi:hypothetical protein